MEPKCEFRAIRYLNGIKYTCFVTEASITQPGTEIAFTGVHEYGKTDKDVEALRFNNTVVHFIPKDIANHFPRLTTLVVRNCGLKEVKRADLQGLENLEYLYLAYNELTTLPDDLLQNMKKLRWIHFHNNLIEFMSSKLLAPTKDNDFQVIEFQGNSKINDFYRKNEHNTVEDLMATIDQTCTPTIENFTFSDIPPKEWVRKQDKLFETGKFSDFTIKVREKEYKVHKGILSAQSPVFEQMLGEGSKSVQNFKEMKNFTEEAQVSFVLFAMELNCEFGVIRYLNGTKYTCYVTEASITQPGTEIAFTGVHEDGKTDKDVKALFFDNAVVEFVPKNIANHFPRLTTLVIRNCGLKEIKRADLQGLENLEYLYLAYNELTTLPDDLLHSMKKLRWIHFHNNLIEFMSSKLLSPIKDNDFQIIDFSDNSKINEYYMMNKHNTVEDLMATIDQNCTPPIASFTFSDNPAKDGWVRKQEELFETGKFSDFTIKVGEKDYKVHKAILAAQSPVFERMLSEGSKSVQSLKEMKNFTENAFEDFLRYFYTGTVKSEENAIELLELADKFSVPVLLQICEQLILEILDDSNLLEVYNIGHAHSIMLKKAAFEGIQRLIPELKDSKIDNVELVNKLMKTKRLFDELIETAGNQTMMIK